MMQFQRRKCNIAYIMTKGPFSYTYRCSLEYLEYSKMYSVLILIKWLRPVYVCRSPPQSKKENNLRNSRHVFM